MKICRYPVSLLGIIFFGFFVVIQGEEIFAFQGKDLAPSPEELLGSNKVPWTLTAGKIEYLKDKAVYRAEGNVVLQSDGTITIKAEKATFSQDSATAILEGNVSLQYGSDWIKGERILWNLNKQTGYVEHGKAYFSKNNFYVDAKRIEKKGDNLYILEEGFITTCSPEAPDWSFGYRRLRVPMGGIATGEHLIFRFGSVPVMFIPWGFLPVGLERQSGFLRPTIGFSSLNGFIFEIPYYWAIDQSHDATFYGSILEKRGFLGGVEYRWNDLKWGEGIILAHYLNDKAGEDHLRSHGFSDSENNRFWIRGRSLVELPYNISARINLDVVSDRSFLSEFTRGSASYEFTNNAFSSFLGSGILADKDVTSRESNAYFFKRWDNTEVAVDLHYWDENDNSLKDITAQQLPSLSLSMTSTPLLALPLYYNLDSSVTQFWRNEGSRGTRITLHPGFILPKTLASFVNTETELRLNTFLYNTEGTGRESSEGITGRAVPSLNTGATMRAEKLYAADFWGISSLRHTISPEIRYEYTPEVKEEIIPSFDMSGDVFHKNRIKYGINSFVAIDRNAATEEWARIGLFQYYRIGEQKTSFFENGFDSPYTTEKGFSDIYMDLSVSPYKYLSLSYNMAISSTDGSVRQHDLMIGLASLTGQTLNIDYRYKENFGINELITSLNWDVLPWLSMGTYQDYSFADNNMIKHGYTITYRRSCWALTLYYEREGEDQRFFASINLLGLGQTTIR